MRRHDGAAPPPAAAPRSDRLAGVFAGTAAPALPWLSPRAAVLAAWFGRTRAECYRATGDVDAKRAFLRERRLNLFKR